jgi:hypothetical protein
MVSDTNSADLAALRQLSEHYALALDERAGDRFAAQFTADGRLLILHGEGTEPVIEIQGSEELAGVPERFLSQYRATMHFVGNHTASVDGATGTGVTYCVAHHVSEDDEDTAMTIWYRDTYRRTDDGWRIAERRLVLRWTETHAIDRAGV